MIGRIIAAAFQFRLIIMALAIDVIDMRDPSNEMRRQLQPNKTIDTIPYDTGLEARVRACLLLVVPEVFKRH